MFELIQKRKRLAQVVLVLLVVPFAFFGLESYTGSFGSRSDVATVNGSSITQQEFAEALRSQRERLRAAFGPGIDLDSLDTPQARRALLEQLISQRLMLDAALRAGLAVGDEELRETIAAIPAFQGEGGFSRSNYEALLRAQNMTPQMFEARLRQDIAQARLTGAVAGTAIVSRTVAARLEALQGERREVQESLVPAQPFLAQVKVGEDEVKAYYEANLAEFQVPARVRAEYLVLSAEQQAGAAQVPEAELRAAYEARAGQFQVSEQRRASHILVKTEEEAKKLAAEVRKAPARFAELAKQHSQDPGSAAAGGDLGFFGRGMMVPAFEDAAFRMKEGEVSEPVKSEFGWHVIRLTGVQPAKARPFSEVREELAAELGRREGNRRFAESAEAFSNMVYEQPDSLKPAAERFGLKLQTSDWLMRTPAASAGVLGNAKLLGALFSDDALQHRRNTDAIEVAPGVLVSARVIEHQPETQRKLEEVRAEIGRMLRAREAARLAQESGTAKLAELRKGGEAGLQWGAAKIVSRRSAQGIPAGALRRIMSADARKLPAYAGAERGAQGYMLYRVTKVLEPEARPDEERSAERQRIAQAAGARQLEAYVASLRERADVEIRAANLEKNP
ncbi:MAG: SurA N-terminal domain-containing protein [Burkholderiales bacterium]